jgi:hypothetical protein
VALEEEEEEHLTPIVLKKATVVVELEVGMALSALVDCKLMLVVLMELMEAPINQALVVMQDLLGETGMGVEAVVVVPMEMPI